MSEFPARSSAEVKTPTRQAPFVAPKPKSPATGYSEPVSGSGFLPKIEQIMWEVKKSPAKRAGTIEAWHLKNPKDNSRKEKIYLGFLGKRILKELAAMPEPERFAVVTSWIAEKRAEKGIES